MKVHTVPVALVFPLVVLCSLVHAQPTSPAPAAGAWQIEGIESLPPSDVERQLQDANPVNCYTYATRLWEEGNKDQAVFWYYAGELRLKFLQLAHPSSSDASAALFNSLQMSVGQPINLYAGADTKKLVDQINSVLKWDAETPNGYTSKTDYGRQWKEARDWLTKVRDQIVAHADEIQKQRAQAGIGEVGVKNGVYLEEHIRKMPADWPPIAPATSVEKIVGIYRVDWQIGYAMFFTDGRRALKADKLEVAIGSPNELILVARRGDDELVRRTIPVRQEGGAIVYEESNRPDYMTDGGIHTTVYLRTNAAGDLVIERDLLTEGTYRNRPMPVHEVNTFWNRAARVNAQ